MAIGYLTSADVLNVRYTEQAIGTVIGTLKATPELDTFYASPIRYANYKVLSRVELPDSYFRNDYAGVPNTVGKFSVEDVVCHYLDSSFEADLKPLNEYVGGPGVFMSDELVAHLQGLWLKVAKQTWYGTNADASGFLGIGSFLSDLNNPQVVDAGGTGANCTSVYAIQTGRQRVAYAWGYEGAVDVSSLYMSKTADPVDPAKFYNVMRQNVSCHIGLQIGTPKALGRIANIDEDHPLTYEMIARLISKMGVMYRPELLFMNNRALHMLSITRPETGGLASPQGLPAIVPTEAYGVPIKVSEAISDEEPAVVAGAVAQTEMIQSNTRSSVTRKA